MELAQNGGKEYVIYFEFGSFEPYNTGFKTFLLKRIDEKWAKRFFQVSLGQTTQHQDSFMRQIGLY